MSGIQGGGIGGASGGAGVTSLNALTGALQLIAGANVTITPLGDTITISATAGGAGIASINGSTVGSQTLISDNTNLLTVTTDALLGVTTFSIKIKNEIKSVANVSLNGGASSTVTFTGFTNTYTQFNSLVPSVAQSATPTFIFFGNPTAQSLTSVTYNILNLSPNPVVNATLQLAINGI